MLIEASAGLRPVKQLVSPRLSLKLRRMMSDIAEKTRKLPMVESDSEITISDEVTDRALSQINSILNEQVDVYDTNMQLLEWYAKSKGVMKNYMSYKDLKGRYPTTKQLADIMNVDMSEDTRRKFDSFIKIFDKNKDLLVNLYNKEQSIINGPEDRKVKKDYGYLSVEDVSELTGYKRVPGLRNANEVHAQEAEKHLQDLGTYEFLKNKLNIYTTVNVKRVVKKTLEYLEDNEKPPTSDYLQKELKLSKTEIEHILEQYNANRELFNGLRALEKSKAGIDSEKKEYEDQTLPKDPMLYVSDVAKVMGMPDGVAESMDEIEKEYADIINELVSTNLALVVKHATDFRNKGRIKNSPLTVSDLITAGMAGFARALSRYNHRLGNMLTTYPVWHIKSDMGRFIQNFRDTIKLPVHLHEKGAKMFALMTRYNQEHEREPTDQEIIKETGLKQHEIDKIKEHMRTRAGTRSLDQTSPSGRSGHETTFDEEVNEEEEHIENYENMELGFQVARINRFLTPREERLLRQEYAIGQDTTRKRSGAYSEKKETLTALGKKYGVSKETIRLEIHGNKKDKPGILDRIYERFAEELAEFSDLALIKRAIAHKFWEVKKKKFEKKKPARKKIKASFIISPHDPDLKNAICELAMSKYGSCYGSAGKGPVKESLSRISIRDTKVKNMDRMELFLHRLRRVHPQVMETLFSQGQCEQLYALIKPYFPKAEFYVTKKKDHAYIKWKGWYYDIYGKHNMDYIRNEKVRKVKFGPEHRRKGKANIKRFELVEKQ